MAKPGVNSNGSDKQVELLKPANQTNPPPLPPPIDETIIQNQFNQAASVKQVLADMHQQTKTAHQLYEQARQAPEQPAVKLPLLARFSRFTSLPPLYQRAILAGLTGAVTILIVLLIYNLLTG